MCGWRVCVVNVCGCWVWVVVQCVCSLGMSVVLGGVWLEGCEWLRGCG